MLLPCGLRFLSWKPSYEEAKKGRREKTMTVSCLVIKGRMASMYTHTSISCTFSIYLYLKPLLTSLILTPFKRKWLLFFLFVCLFCPEEAPHFFSLRTCLTSLSQPSHAQSHVLSISPQTQESPYLFYYRSDYFPIFSVSETKFLPGNSSDFERHS